MQNRESESKYCLSVLRTENKLLKWRASLFAFGGFGYFCHQKYQNELVSYLDSVFQRNDKDKILAYTINIGYSMGVILFYLWKPAPPRPVK